MRSLNLSLFLIVMSISVAQAAPKKNLIELHKNAGKLTTKQCLHCHSKIKKEVSWNKKYKMMHRVHLESKLETPKSCNECHESVDLRNGSAATLRKQVHPDNCVSCHDGSMDKAKVLYGESKE